MNDDFFSAEERETQKKRVAGCSGCYYAGRLTGDYRCCEYISVTGHRRDSTPKSGGGCDKKLSEAEGKAKHGGDKATVIRWSSV